MAKLDEAGFQVQLPLVSTEIMAGDLLLLLAHEEVDWVTSILASSGAELGTIDP